MIRRRLRAKPAFRCALASLVAGLAFGCADHENDARHEPPGDRAPPHETTLASPPGTGEGADLGETPTPGAAAESSASTELGSHRLGTWSARVGRDVRYVLLISVDGLAPRFLNQLLSADRVPAFARLAKAGAATDNARTDPLYTYTLPNHTCMLTGLPVMAAPGAPREQGHGYTANSEPGPNVTLHNSGNPARSYTPSVFDVVHDHGLATAMFASKPKFHLFTNSYNDAGAADRVGVDNGTRKIDLVEINGELTALTDSLIAALREAPPSFSFVHFGQPDAAGHAHGWGGAEYLDAVIQVDVALGQILSLLESEPALADHAAIILTADHGGTGGSHLDATNPNNFVIPFRVLGPGIPGGSDLYSLVAQRRTPPASDANPDLDVPGQPIRNGDAGNLALALLGLPPVPGSLMASFGLAPGVHSVSGTPD